MGSRNSWVGSSKLVLVENDASWQKKTHGFLFRQAAPLVAVHVVLM